MAAFQRKALTEKGRSKAVKNHDENDPILVLASGNAGKIREFQAMFSHLNVHVKPKDLRRKSLARSPFTPFIENCLAKARHAAKETGRPAMADDSGLCVDALGGAPGVYSARFAGEDATDEDNNRLLMEKLHGVKNRQGHYVCVLVAVRSPDDPEPLIAEGTWEGVIAEAPKGQRRLWVRPYFYLPEAGATAAELSPEAKMPPVTAAKHS